MLAVNFFSLDNLFTLMMLVLLQAVLGFDNLLYISLESKRAPADRQAYVRRMGIGIAIFLRIALLFILVQLLEKINVTLIEIPEGGWISGKVDVHSIIVLVGGIFILYTAVKEIFHMMHLEVADDNGKKKASVGKIIFWIVLMNLVFSFDSILSAMALAGRDNFWTMAVAICIGGVLMIVLADTVASFLQKNRLYEVLGLFILFVVGILLISEGGHLAHLHIFGAEITAMSKATFYFVIFILVLTDIVQSRYHKKLLAKAELAAQKAGMA